MINRVEKVNSLLEHEIGKILLHDFAFSPDILVTLTHADTSSNMIESKIYISVFPEEKAQGILNALEKSTYDIQYKINRVLRMRPVPKIKFIRDKEIAKAAKIEALLYEVEKQNEVEKKIKKK